MPALDNTNTGAYKLAQAISAKEPNTESIQEGYTALANDIEKKIVAKMDSMKDGETASATLGLKQPVDSAERKFVAQLIESGDAMNNVGALVPPTTVNRVMEDLVQKHDLLKYVDVINGGLTTEFIYSIGAETAFWGALCSDIQELTDKGFRTVTIGQFKLSAFMPVCKAFLDLNSPEWLISYVTTVLSESIAIAIEKAIIDGTGKDQPIGMRRSLVNVTDGTHNETPAVEIDGFGIDTLGDLMAQLSVVNLGKDKDGVVMTKERDVAPTEVLIIMNPITYWKSFFKEYTVQNSLGQYVSSLGLPFKVITSLAMPKDEYVIGVGKDYLFVLGAEPTMGFSDENRYIQDQRIYLTKMYGNGTPKTEGAFIRATLKAPAKTTK